MESRSSKGLEMFMRGYLGEGFHSGMARLCQSLAEEKRSSGENAPGVTTATLVGNAELAKRARSAITQATRRETGKCMFVSPQATLRESFMLRAMFAQQIGNVHFPHLRRVLEPQINRLELSEHIGSAIGTSSKGFARTLLPEASVPILQTVHASALAVATFFLGFIAKKDDEGTQALLPLAALMFTEDDRVIPLGESAKEPGTMLLIRA